VARLTRNPTAQSSEQENANVIRVMKHD
jgi:hypothetical protein